MATQPLTELYTGAAGDEGVDGFAAVDAAALTRYREQGYLVVRNAFLPEEWEAALAGLLALIAGRRPEFADFEFEAAAPDDLPTRTPEQRQDALRKLMNFTPFEPRLKAIAEHPQLTALLTRLLGETPVRFQDMALLKPPHLGREKPWHQDMAYFDMPPNTRVVGVWIALDEATVENGCMHLLAGAHRNGPVLHFQRRDWQICDTAIPGSGCVAVPLMPGGCLLFDGLLPHGTPPNRSPRRRRALQFHYRPASATATSGEERLAVFGGEGQGVSC